MLYRAPGSSTPAFRSCVLYEDPSSARSPKFSCQQRAYAPYFGHRTTRQLGLVGPKMVLYTGLIFRNSALTITSWGDTVFYFTYHLTRRDSTLTLTDWTGRRSSSKILKLSADSLVVDKLWNLKTIQCFQKVTPR
jgi:hypothetical protein